jgi:type IV pilus assembly protein PilE
MQDTIPKTDAPSRARDAKGFTLIELVVAMVIAALLVSIAIPAYSSFVRKSRRTEAKSTIMDLASLEERYFSTANVYSSTPSDLGYGTATWSATSGITVGSGYYQVLQPQIVAAVAPTTTTSGSPATFTITVIPVATNDQAKDTACASFTVTSSGARSATMTSQTGPDNTPTCWQ